MPCGQHTTLSGRIRGQPRPIVAGAGQEGDYVPTVDFFDVYLIRHAESEANAAGRFAFRSWDPALTAAGRAQAAQLVQRFEGTPLVAIASSPLTRARQTIAPLAQARGLDVLILAELAEVDLGEWDGASLSDLHERDPRFHAWRSDPDRHPPPGGERLTDVGIRVERALETLQQQFGRGGVAVATHADCIKGVALRVLGCSGEQARRLSVPNLGQLHLRRGRSPRWQLVLDNRPW